MTFSRPDLLKKFKHFLPILSTALLLTFLNGCDLLGDLNDPDNDTSDLQGEWFRIESNNPSNDNMVIEVTNTQGVITDKANSSFNNGDIKWNNISSTETATLFDYEELGSDGSYYTAQMELADDTTLLIDIVSTGAGNTQKWLRMGSVYGGSAETQELDCNIDSETVLVDGPAEVDYLVTCVVDVTAALTIEAGVVIEFEENTGLGIYDGGTLKAIGETEKNIVFRGTQDVKGFWRGIHIETRSVNNVLDHVQISNTGSNYVYCCNTSAAIFLKGGLMSVDNVVIVDGGGSGIAVNGDAEFNSFTNVTITGHEEYPITTVANALGFYGHEGNSFSGNTMDYIYVTDRKLSEAVTWESTDIPYLLNGNVIDITAPLTIEAGTEILVEENGGLGVYDNGTLSVNGTSGAPVIIKGKEPVAGYWRGIYIETNSFSNDLNYFEIYDAGSNYVYCCGDIASLFLKSGSCALSNVTIGRAKEYGIVAKDAFSFSAYENVEVNSDKEPLLIAAERVDEIEANGNLSGNGIYNYIKLENSDVDDPVTFKDQNIPYYLDFVLDVTQALTIEAGVEMVFSEDAGLGVYDAGTLSVHGTAENKVVFSGYQAVQGFWRGIHCETNSISNVIDHAQILYAGGNYVYCCNEPAGLFVKSGTFTLTNSEVSGSGGYGVYVGNSGSLTEAGNIFSNNTNGDIGYQ